MNLHANTNATAQDRNYLSFADRIKLAEQMGKVISKRGKGRCAYIEGWSDKRVVEEVLGGRATALNVVNMRKQLFGNLVEYKRNPRKTTSNTADIAALELRIETLEKQLKVFLSYYIRHNMPEKVLLNPELQK